MITLEQYKKVLGVAVEQLPDEQILALMEKQRQLADVLFDLWKQNLMKNPKQVDKSQENSL